MRKSVIDGLMYGAFRHCTVVKTGIFATAAASRLRLNVGSKICNRNRVNHKKIASFHVLTAPLQSLPAKLIQSKANVVLGALPIFVTSQKLGAKSCSK